MTMPVAGTLFRLPGISQVPLNLHPPLHLHRTRGKLESILIMNHFKTARISNFLREHWIPILLALLWGIVLSAYAWLRHMRINSSTFDLGIKSQVIWNTWRGDWFASTIEVSNYLGDHVQLIFLLLAPLLGFWRDVRILLIVQAFLLSLGAIPVYRIALRKLGDQRLAVLFSLVYLLYPLLGFVNRFDFHPVVFTIPFFLVAYDLLESNQPGWATLFILLSLSLREEVGLTVFAFGIYASVFMDRRRLGLVWAGTGLTWSLFALFWLMPAFRGEVSDTVGRYVWLGESPGQILTNLISRPRMVLEHLLVPYRAAVPLKLFLPVGFLALIAPAPLLVTLPALAYNLLSETPSQSSIYFQYLAPAVPFIFIAAIQGATRVQGWIGEKKAPAILAIVLGSGMILAWIWDNPFTQTIDAPYFPVYGLEPQIDSGPFYRALELLPTDADVATMMAYGPHVALRRQFSLFYDRLQLLERPYGFPQAEYLLLNLSDLRWGVNARFFYNAILTAIGRFGYEAIFAENDVVLLKKGIEPQALTGAVAGRVQELLEAGGKYAPAAQETIGWLGQEWIVDSPPQTAMPHPARFEEGISLLAHESPVYSAPGRPLCVILYWQTERELTTDYTVFVHLAAADGFVQAQNDSQPTFGYHPTSGWKPGEILADLHCLVMPPTLASGDYTLRTGLYDPENGMRLSLIDSPSPDDALNLTTISINVLNR
jgi:uncharacterized membrane protein